ncbi:hypothetical protein E4L96_15725 [Massilia arenosa]|uniref:Dienelactone hydrolase domain-containing protein n=1 Tax=Zemynaea arenosa TaxID=2561931 RepID=A0A4Y9S8H4_9BURK|nr:dienelactone hydrolase family protein [Massilia arenosa]TFW16784.1 hypothetical protein E4L96_15725 [Massilia arenosa]
MGRWQARWLVWFGLSVLAPLAAAQERPFAAVLAAPAPALLTDRAPAERLDDRVTVRHLAFRSLDVPGPNGPVANEVYALLALPTGPGPYPALVVLHPGREAAQRAIAIAWARRGYVAISPDLPGIADPARARHSRGLWTGKPYGSDRWLLRPAAASSTLFQAAAAGIGAVRVLQQRADVDRGRIGIVGASFGAYETLLLAGLLGDDIRAAYVVWGSGYFDETSFSKDMADLSPADRARWHAVLGAENYLQGIKADLFLAATSNDRAFWLPAVARTFEGITARKNLVIGPNADHASTGYPGAAPRDPDGSWTEQEIHYFAHALQGSGPALPVARLERVAGDTAVVQVLGTDIRSVTVYSSATDAPYPKRTWVALPDSRVSAGADGRYRIDLRALGLGERDWFVQASDARGTSSSTLPQRWGGAAR